MIKVISFDLDGTLIDINFDELIWFEEIPKLYAEKYKLPIEKAKEKVFAEYHKEKGNLGWVDIDFWFDKFGLTEADKFLSDLKHNIKLFPEVKKSIFDLSKNYKLIIITRASKKFMDLKLDVENLKDYFSDVFSTVHHFKTLKKDEEIYKKVIKKLDINPEEMAHIGDHLEFDFNIPRKLGINAYYLDREKSKHGDFIVHNLSEFAKKIMEIK